MLEMYLLTQRGRVKWRLESRGKCQGISQFLESGHPVSCDNCFIQRIFCDMQLFSKT